jgi:bifunctional non-homologous end joining protein LigD
MATKRKPAKQSPADAVDGQLARYRSMRDFEVTAEPSGASPTRRSATAKKATSDLPFVIQKHAATRLHYDFRLGWKGVLKSWAVAKGPSYFPGDKRLAVQVEDHPMEYGGFEGTIPKGQYGGGTVMLWDEGTWEPQAGHTDVEQGLRAGSLKFILHGSKMKGKWALVRMGGKAAGESKPNWLLIKEHDDFERKREDPPITDESPHSVVTRRSLDEIARSSDHVWNSKQTASGNAWFRANDGVTDAPPAKVANSNPRRTAPRKAGGLAPYDFKKSPKEELPAFVPPQLAQQASVAPTADGWLHELKLDGYRIQARKDGPKVQLLTRTGLDWTRRMKAIAAAVATLPAKTLLADGEVVVLADDGTTSFADLQAAFQDGEKKPLTYFVFDLLHLNGHNLRGLPLRERKTLLATLVGGNDEIVRLSEHIETSGDAMFRKACELHAEGIVSKRADSTYIGGRGGSWVKLKCIRRQELVIGGFTLPSNGIHGVGALLLGYYRGDKLIYAGRTGTGFSQQTHGILRDRLEKLRTAATPFEAPPVAARRGAIWVRPELVAQVNFATWTADGLVRQASFQGLREDKPAAEVVREETAATRKGANPATASMRAACGAQAAASAKSDPAKASKTGPAPIRLTHPDKLLDTDSGLTKQQLADYYWEIAPHMLPHLSGRPLSLVRCPNGVGKPCFFQKHANGMLPPGVESVQVPDKKTGKPEAYITLSSASALAELAQMGVLEVHPWGSTNTDLERPDRLIIDLDPDAAISWTTLAASAAEVRQELGKLGIESFLKLTGGKGLHIVVALRPEFEWPIVKQFAHAFAVAMEKREPSLYLTKMNKAARAGRIFIDYLRNERGATAVAACSPRARPGGNVSLPIRWADLELAEHPVFRVAHFDRWKDRLKRDPWKELAGSPQRITPETLRLFDITV